MVIGGQLQYETLHSPNMIYFITGSISESGNSPAKLHDV